MKTENIVINKEKNVTMTAYLQLTGGEFSNIEKRPAILILPGGAYFMCSEREADPVAFSYLEAGYHVFILHYSVGKDVIWPDPLEDYEKAMEMIRSKETEWQLYSDKIAVIGFSAGGHLAACAATMARNKPNAALLGYAVIDKETVSGFLPSAPDAADAVDENTCPCFVFASRTDTTVPVRNSLKMVMALTEYDIAYESHIYAYGTHGFSTSDSSLMQPGTKVCSRTHQWVTDSVEWLADIFGEFADQGMTEPKCAVKVNGNHELFYNVNCTVKYLMGNEKVMDILKPYLKPLTDMMHIEEVPTSMREMLLKEVLGFIQLPQEVIQELDEKLKTIPNKRMA